VKAFRVIVEGRVQGVCFRHYTQQEANRLGVTGWVRNCSDGSVEAMICGDDAPIDAMLAWLNQGPSSATVTNVRTEPATPTLSSAEFIITY